MQSPSCGDGCHARLANPSRALGESGLPCRSSKSGAFPSCTDAPEGSRQGRQALSKSLKSFNLGGPGVLGARQMPMTGKFSKRRKWCGSTGSPLAPPNAEGDSRGFVKAASQYAEPVLRGWTPCATRKSIPRSRRERATLPAGPPNSASLTGSTTFPFSHHPERANRPPNDSNSPHSRG